MIKKFLAKLVSSWDRMPNLSKQREKLEVDLMKERRVDAIAHEQERVRKQREERKIPSDSEILGPSDSVPKEEQK